MECLRTSGGKVEEIEIVGSKGRMRILAREVRVGYRMDLIRIPAQDRQALIFYLCGSHGTSRAESFSTQSQCVYG